MDTTTRERSGATPVGVPSPPRRPVRPRRHEPRRSIWRRLGKLALWLTVLGLAVAAIAIAALLWYASTVPLPTPPQTTQTSFLFDATGAQLAELPSKENRIEIPYQAAPGVYQYRDLPPYVVQAFVAREDRRFFSHPGIDVQGIVRALWADLNDEQVQGGSTIPQQYVKNAFLDSRRSLSRKLREAIIAVKLSRRYSKDRIMSLYLNTVYFGRSAYGIEQASREFFNKSARQLTVGEAAYLAGLVSGPELALPEKNPEEAMRRRDATIDAMVVTKALTPAQGTCEKLICTPQGVPALDATGKTQRRPIPIQKGPRRGLTTTGPMAYFADYVVRELRQRFGDKRTFGGGLRVTTTIDPAIQASAVQARDEVLDQDGDPEAAIVTLDLDGRIRAMVGGRDYAKSKVNLATGKAGGGVGRQVGSTFKPIVLAAALADGISAKKGYPAPDQVDLGSTKGCGDWSPKNSADGEGNGGNRDLLQAMAASINTVYAQVAVDVGADKVAAMAKDLGVDTPLPACPRIALGSEGISALEMANVYTTFANRGQRPLTESQAITEVRDSVGNVIWKPGVIRKQVLDPNDADIVTTALQGVVTSGTGKAAQIKNQPVAGKTGTTNDYHDAWFDGFTPSYITTVWVGYVNNDSMNDVHGRRVFGGTFPAEIWKAHMSRVMQGKDPGSFTEPTDFGGSAQAPAKPKKRKPASSAGDATTSSQPATSTSKPASSTTTKAPPTT